jgi:hypothetical protein
MGPVLSGLPPGPAGLWGSTCLNIFFLCKKKKKTRGALLIHAKNSFRSVYKKLITLVISGRSGCLRDRSKDFLPPATSEF